MLKNICLIACLLLTASFSFSSPSASRSIGGQVDKAQQTRPTKPEIFSTRSAPVVCTIIPSGSDENSLTTPLFESRSVHKERVSACAKPKSTTQRIRQHRNDEGGWNLLAVLGFAFGIVGFALSILGVITAYLEFTAAILFIPLSILCAISGILLCALAIKSEKRNLALIGILFGLGVFFLPAIFWSIVIMRGL